MKKNIIYTDRSCDIFCVFEIKRNSEESRAYISNYLIKDIWLYPYPFGYQKKSNERKILTDLEKFICKELKMTPDMYKFIHVGYMSVSSYSNVKGSIDFNED